MYYVFFRYKEEIHRLRKMAGLDPIPLSRMSRLSRRWDNVTGKDELTTYEYLLK